MSSAEASSFGRRGRARVDRSWYVPVNGRPAASKGNQSDWLECTRDEVAKARRGLSSVSKKPR